LTGGVSALAYGGQRGGAGFTNVALVGTGTGPLFFRGETGSAFSHLPPPPRRQGPPPPHPPGPPDPGEGLLPQGPPGLLFPPNTAPLAPPASGSRVTGGARNATLTLPTSQLSSVTVFAPPGGTAVPLVGGLGGVFRMLPPPAGGSAMATWTLYGQGLPHVV